MKHGALTLGLSYVLNLNIQLIKTFIFLQSQTEDLYTEDIPLVQDLKHWTLTLFLTYITYIIKR